MRIVLLAATAMTLVSTGAWAQQDYPAAKGAVDTPPPLEQRVSRMPVARGGEVINSIGSGAIPAVLAEEHSQNGIEYITGGVGDEELAVFKEKEKDFNTRILLSAKSGEYMGEVSLRFTDKTGNDVFSIDGAGPYFYANLPTGTYTVEATTAKGSSQTTKITVSDKPKGRVVIRF